MSLLSQWIFDPIKKLISEAAAVPELIDLAGKAEAAYATGGAQGVTEAIVDTLEGGLQAVVDAAITGALGNLGPAGAALQGEGLALANEAVAYIESHTNAVVASLFGAAKKIVPAAPAAAAA